jgi:hypothetical protein
MAAANGDPSEVKRQRVTAEPAMTCRGWPLVLLQWRPPFIRRNDRLLILLIANPVPIRKYCQQSSSDGSWLCVTARERAPLRTEEITSLPHPHRR